MGTWDWVRTGGHSFCPGWATPESEGYRIMVIFTPDSFYRSFRNDTLLELDEQFWVVVDRDSNGLFGYTDILRGSTNYEQYRFIEPDTLVLIENALDACFRYFKRK